MWRVDLQGAGVELLPQLSGPFIIYTFVESRWKTKAFVDLCECCHVYRVQNEATNNIYFKLGKNILLWVAW